MANSSKDGSAVVVTDQNDDDIEVIEFTVHGTSDGENSLAAPPPPPDDEDDDDDEIDDADPSEEDGGPAESQPLLLDRGQAIAMNRMTSSSSTSRSDLFASSYVPQQDHSPLDPGL